MRWFSLFPCAALAGICLAGPEVRHNDPPLGLRLAEGFEVSEFADSALANDIFSMAIDQRGRVTVSGRGYIRILRDDDGDGRADHFTQFADGPQDGAQGMLWERESLLVTGDGGLRRYRGTNGDDRADGPSELIRAFKTGGEHDAHDIKRGPDGWLYVLCGNQTGIDRSFAQQHSSPIRHPVAGCVIRLSPDLKLCEIVADGLRNAYRMDFNLADDLFTFDSDNERCVSLPWYEPTRFYHVISGGHYGWQSPQHGQFFRLPPYAVDVVAPVAYLGRGSPTGVLCYRGYQFPDHYQGGFFLADWTFGRIYFVPLDRQGASYNGRPELFLEAVGESGFAPTDLALDPLTGDMYVSVGGRGTRGGVYRIRKLSGSSDAGLTPLKQRQVSGAHEVSQDGVKRWLGPAEFPGDAAARWLQQARSSGDPERLIALEMVCRYQSRFHSDEILDCIRANWNHADRYLRLATSHLIAGLGTEEAHQLAKEPKQGWSLITWALGEAEGGRPRACMVAGSQVLNSSAPPDEKLAAARLLQLAWGGLTPKETHGTVWEGYSARQTNPAPSCVPTLDRSAPDRDQDLARAVWDSVHRSFPSGHPDLDREITRLLAVHACANGPLNLLVSEQLTAVSDPVDDIHYLAVLARMDGGWAEPMGRAVARSLLNLDRKCTERRLNRDRHWPIRLAEIHAELVRRDRHLNSRILASNEFGRSDHVLLAQSPGFDRSAAARIFLRRAAADGDFAWSPALIELIGLLPDAESRPVLRGQWENLGLRDAILEILARDPRREDLSKFLEGLGSAQLDTMRACLAAIAKVSPDRSGENLLPVLRAMRRLRGGKEEDALRTVVGQTLRALTGQRIDPGDADAWTKWFTGAYPEAARGLESPDGVDLKGWMDRLVRLDWSSGDASRGRDVFQRTGCNACHSGSRALGPDLSGVAARFSREDLFTAILQPSRDVSPRYQTMLVATDGGRVFQGAVIYEAVDSLILQTGADSIIRLTNDQIVERRHTSNSLMPAGLLDKLTDQDIADLYIHLREMR